MWSSFLQSKSLTRLIYGILGILIGIILHDFMTFNGINIENILKIIVAPTVIFMSLLLTARQFVYNREWNKKDAAIKAIYISREKTQKYNDRLNVLLNTTYLIQHDLSLSVIDIHNKMGVFLEDGSFIFHGDETDNDIQNIHTQENSGYRQDFDKDIDGREIKNLITKILNEYEYISMSCNLDIFDKNVIIELRAGGIVKTFNVFISHIYHARYDKRHGYGQFLYIHFENFVKEIVKDKKLDLKIKEIPKKEAYMTPFNDATKFK